jgi:hypothetical protein
MDFDTLDEAYERLHRTGPEYQGRLSNHGPMAVEALVWHGHGDGVHRWLDSYLAQLDELPRGGHPIEDWRASLGDPKRAGDWLAFFARTLDQHPWRDVLATWWPRLLPGIAAGATHGVIRVGHAVRALRAETNPGRVTELGQALGYWAARWQPVPGAAGLTGTTGVATELTGTTGVAAELTGTTGVAAALDRVPRIPEQTGGIRVRFARLPDVPEWPASVTALRPPRTPAQVAEVLAEVVHQASLHYLRFGHGSPVMLVHAVTAPTAVLRTLPELDQALWAPSLAAAWAATAAITAGYAPTVAASPPASPFGSVDEAFARAARHGDAHVVKLADAVVDVYARTADERALSAAAYAAQLI